MLNSLGSPGSRRVYELALDQFIAWYCSEPRLAFNRIVVTRYRMYLESRGLAVNTINQQLAADAGLMSPELAVGISRVKGVKHLGFRTGNWLSADECSSVLRHASGTKLPARGNYAFLDSSFRLSPDSHCAALRLTSAVRFSCSPSPLWCYPSSLPVCFLPVRRARRSLGVRRTACDYGRILLSWRWHHRYAGD